MYMSRRRPAKPHASRPVGLLEQIEDGEVDHKILTGPREPAELAYP